MRRAPADTPLMRQYLDVKDRYPDGIVFFRLGDFYEMFFEDAVLAARALDLTLTTRDKGRDDAIPMCGVPHHSARGYVARLLELGHKVVICEQLEDPRFARGIVKRDVTRVVTPGIVLDEEVLDARAPRYVAAVCAGVGERRGLAYLDVSTGDFRATEVEGDAALVDELLRAGVRELVAADALSEALRDRIAATSSTVAFSTPTTPVAPALLLPEALGRSLDALGLAALPLAAEAATMVVGYARATQPGGALPLSRLVVYRAEESVVLDEAARAHLELVETLVERRRQGSLLGVLDETRTAPGGRMLRSWLLFPLTSVSAIRERHDAVEWLVDRAALRGELRQVLGELHDLERLAGRIQLGTAAPRDLVLLRRSLERLPEAYALLARADAPAAPRPTLLSPPSDGDAELALLAEELGSALADDAPAQAKAREGGFVRAGYSAEIDDLRRLADGGKEALVAIETRERERTGISSLKVRYNRVFGYYLEITRAHLKNAPPEYVRKQTLAGAERFVTPELAELEAKVLGAEERLGLLETTVFEELRARAATRLHQLLAAGARAATIDVLATLAEVAHRSSFVRPVVDEGEVIEIEDGRHPVVERFAAPGGFVPNDCLLDCRGPQLVVITGPNMAGKSTYLRQVAQIALLAQLGSFVPARRARIGVVDRIFTRVGAADNLARGDSTFMVEMRETAAILRHATRRSLVVLDEIGRGTSTYDGLSIAIAVAEYLHDAIGARTLFATHYHELCELAARLPRVKNVSVAVREQRGELIFLRKVVDGGASRSYGIEVARLAGLPGSVVARARQVLAGLEDGGGGGPTGPRGAQAGPSSAAGPAGPSSAAGPAAPARSGPNPVDLLLAGVDPDATTPLEALQILAELRRLAAATTSSN